MKLKKQKFDVNVFRILVSTGLVLMIVGAGCPFIGYTNVSVSKAHQLWQDGAFMLDVRTAGEFANSHIPGAYNIDVDELLGRLDEISDRKSDPIVVYCSCGLFGRSMTASQHLVANGFTNIHNMEDPYPAWINAGYETES